MTATVMRVPIVVGLIALIGLSTRPVLGQDSGWDVVIGGEPTTSDLDSLSDAGYETVVSVMATTEMDWDQASAVDSAGLTFYRIPMDKPVEKITDEQLAQLDEVLARSGKTYLHCGTGNRAAALWAAWMIEFEDAEVDQALARAESFGLRPEMRALVLNRLKQSP